MLIIGNTNNLIPTDLIQIIPATYNDGHFDSNNFGKYRNYIPLIPQAVLSPLVQIQ